VDLLDPNFVYCMNGILSSLSSTFQAGQLEGVAAMFSSAFGSSVVRTLLSGVQAYLIYNNNSTVNSRHAWVARITHRGVTVAD